MPAGPRSRTTPRRAAPRAGRGRGRSSVGGWPPRCRALARRGRSGRRRSHDAGAPIDAGTGWCSQHPGHTFCDDFDEYANINALLSGWSSYEQSGGSLRLDSSNALSAPNALEAEGTSGSQVLVLETFPLPAQPSTLRLEFESALQLDRERDVAGSRRAGAGSRSAMAPRTPTRLFPSAAAPVCSRPGKTRRTPERAEPPAPRPPPGPTRRTVSGPRATRSRSTTPRPRAAASSSFKDRPRCSPSACPYPRPSSIPPSCRLPWVFTLPGWA